ncbi:MAG: leucine-rich repeat domain-containing protein [Muribaculaceae bacterium]|nr:leucine-rich repeat domain-containing protein [Muribaculaceae bacterium]
MRKYYYLLPAALLTIVATSIGASMKGEKEATVQGIPYFSTSSHQTDPNRTPRSRTEINIPDPGTAGGDISSFTLDSIKNWSGEGTKRAGLVIQWNNGKDNYALAFGYRFEGRPTGIDMLRCVVENNPQLYGLFQRTNVSSGTEKFGYTINGIGWDTNNSGLPVKIIDTGNGDEEYSSYTGFFEHPRGCNENVSYPDYDYDNWISADPDDYWQAGWYKGYWSYWLKDGNGGFSYSGVGASGRTLSDGSWDGWNFQPDMQMYDWKPVYAVPSLVPEGFTEIFTLGGVTYQLKDNSNAQVIRGEQPYSGEITIPATVTTKDGTFSVSSIGSEAFANCAVTKVSIPSTVGTIGKKAFANTDLTEVYLPDGLSEMKDSVFFGCSKLAEINIPSTLSQIPTGAFSGTGLTELSFPNSVTIIQTRAYKDCKNLKEIIFPAEVSQISSEAFAGCDKITKITLDATLPLTISDDVFSETAYSTATLVVPEGFREAYVAAQGWKNFTNITTHLLPVNVGDKFLFNGVPIRITSVEPNTATVTYNHFNGRFRETAVETANAKLSGDLVVPETVEYMGKTFKVTEIQPYSFYGAYKVTSVKLPADIRGFGPHIFDGCYNLTSVELPDNITSFPEGAFDGCSKLTEIGNMPEVVDTIGASAFNQCSKLTSFPFIKEGLKVIATSAFSNSGLNQIIIPATVDSIGYQAFAWSKLTNITVPESVTKLGLNIFYQCSQLTAANLPASMTEIPQGMFFNCKALTAIEVPDGVKKINDNAFYGCSKLANVTLPPSLESIGKEAFRSAASLTQIALPDKLNTISDNAFYGCKLTSLIIPAGVDSIGKNAFYGGAFTEVVYPANVTRTGGYTFAGCSSLTKITFPDNLVCIPDGLLKDCKNLVDLVIPAACKKIGDESFYGCAALDIAIPSQLESIGKKAFYGCKAIKSVNIPRAITTIPEALFRDCSALSEINFAPGTKVIEKQAFYGCKALETMTLPATLDSIGTDLFYGCTSLKEVTFPEGIQNIPNSMFNGCASLETVNLGSTLKSIGDYAFSGCYALSSAPLPATLETLGTRVFQNCTSLESVELPKNIVAVPTYTFSGCSNLAEVKLSENTSGIDSYAFSKCKNLTSISFPETLTSIGSSAFADCSALVPVYPKSLEKIGAYAFSNCTSITTFELPDSLKTIEGSAFQGCTGLPETIEIPATITSLGGAVIQGTNVKTVYVCDPVGTAAFDYTFRIVSSWSNPVYCDVVVPYGYVEKCSELTGYKNAQSLTEPELSQISFSTGTVVATGESADITADIDPVFSEILSPKFQEASRNGFNNNVDVELIYSFVRELTKEDEQGVSMYREEGSQEEKSTEAFINEDKKFEANLEELKPNSVYTFKWRVSTGDNVIESEPEFLTTTTLPTSIDNVIIPTEPVEIYSFTGEYIGRFESIDKVRLTGIFIVIQNKSALKATFK